MEGLDREVVEITADPAAEPHSNVISAGATMERKPSDKKSLTTFRPAESGVGPLLGLITHYADEYVAVVDSSQQNNLDLVDQVDELPVSSPHLIRQATH